VGARAFDVTLTDIDGKKIKTPEGFRPNRSLEELCRTIGRTMEEATHQQHNVIIRPRSTTAALIQLDDLDAEKAAQIAPHVFMLLCTSPQNHQAWVAVKDAPADKDQAKDFARRLRKGAGADPTATGATRISGSLNFKTKYAPAFPMVQITHTQAGKVTTAAEIENAGLVADREEPQPPAGVPPKISRPGQKLPGERRWPDYQQALSGAPRKTDGSPDRSLADFMWCKWAVERGHSIEETAEKLAVVSAKAQERIRVKEDKGNTPVQITPLSPRSSHSFMMPPGQVLRYRSWKICTCW
jgi:hypothetical protein